MYDTYGRTIDYMRISITDRCNLRCRYCMPEGIARVPMSEILTLEEICRIAEAAASQGIRQIKVTGGEPLVRKGCCELIGMLKDIPGIEKVTITTNGMLLGRYLEELVAAGLDGINISLDTLDRELYEWITGTDGLEQVMEVLALLSGLSIPVKINAVSLDFDGLAAHKSGEKKPSNVWGLLELARDHAVDVRFIELMPIGHGKDFPPLGHDRLYQMIREAYPGIEPDEGTHGAGPAVYYRIPGFLGSIGFISAIHGKFCGSCNRIRLTSQGYLRSCLCYEDGVDLRGILRQELPEQKKREMLADAICEAVRRKPDAHCFDRPEQMPGTRYMSEIGG